MEKYRKYLSSVLFLFIVTFVFAGNAMADVSVQGKIKTSDGSTNAGGASVSVTCNATTIPTTADTPSGNFNVNFTTAQCSDGDSITVNASFNGENASFNGTADNNVNFGNIILAAVAVPEFGLITGALAAAGSAFAYFKLRRKIA